MLTSSFQEGQLWMHVIYIFNKSAGCSMQTHTFITITLNEIRWCLKNFVSKDFIIQDHRWTMVDETTLMCVRVRVYACRVKAGGGYTIYSCESSACQVRFASSCSPKSIFNLADSSLNLCLYLSFFFKNRHWGKRVFQWLCVRNCIIEGCSLGVWQWVWEAKQQPDRRVLLLMKLSIP